MQEFVTIGSWGFEFWDRSTENWSFRVWGKPLAVRVKGEVFRFNCVVVSV